MRKIEAEYVGSLLNTFGPDELSPIVNLGSSTLEFRRSEQPHIDREIFAPLQKRGIKIIHSDLKAAEGVDVVGSIYDPAVRRRLQDVGAKLVLCCNIMEHVADANGLMRICAALVGPGGKLLITLPFSYPYHPDPIDTGLRLAPEEVARHFEGFEVTKAKVLRDGTYLDDLRREKALPTLLRQFVAHLLKFFWPFASFEMWKARYHRYLWLFRPYRVSCVLLTKKLPAVPYAHDR